MDSTFWGNPSLISKNPPIQAQLLFVELNAVLLSVEEHDYRAALLLQNAILTQADGCATTGAPDKSDLITNCLDQSEF